MIIVWKLVGFIRHLPKLSKKELELMNEVNYSWASLLRQKHQRMEAAGSPNSISLGQSRIGGGVTGEPAAALAAVELVPARDERRGMAALSAAVIPLDVVLGRALFGLGRVSGRRATRHSEEAEDHHERDAKNLLHFGNPF